MNAQANVPLLAATTAAAVSGATGAPFICKQSGFRELVAQLNVTAAATEASDTLDVFIDGSLDGGVTWINIMHFTQVLGNGGAKKFINVSVSTVSDKFDVTSDLAAGATPRALIGTMFRPRWTVVDGGGVAAGFTFSITGSFKE